MKLFRNVFHLTCVALFIISAVTVIMGANAAEEKLVMPTDAINEHNADRIALELEKKRHELQSREQALADRERILDERDAELEKKIKELASIRDGINATVESRRKDNEEKVRQMVTVFESMQPKAVSQVFETLDDWLAVDVLRRMDVKKTAKIMNLMNRERSAKLSELLTGYYRAGERSTASIAPQKTADSTTSEKPVASEKR